MAAAPQMGILDLSPILCPSQSPFRLGMISRQATGARGLAGEAAQGRGMPGVAVGDPALSACLAAGGGSLGLPPYLAQSSGNGKWREQGIFRSMNKRCWKKCSMHKEYIHGQLLQQAKEGPVDASVSVLSYYTPVFLRVCFTCKFWVLF